VVTDQELIFFALRQVGLIVAEHLESRTSDADEVVTQLIAVLDTQELAGSAIRRPPDIPIWKLEAALKCRSCKKGRYAPPVHMTKLTQEDHALRMTIIIDEKRHWR
jgi:uncharacterized UBP type Zn finger protein